MHMYVRKYPGAEAFNRANAVFIFMNATKYIIGKSKITFHCVLLKNMYNTTGVYKGIPFFLFWLKHRILYSLETLRWF